MTKKLPVFLAALSLVTYSYAEDKDARANDRRETVEIKIESKIRVDKALEDEFMKEAQKDGKMLTKKWADARGVEEVETTVDRDECDSTCKKEMVRCTDCGGEQEVGTGENATKCACGKPKTKKCCSCGKACGSCSSCSSCCK